MFKFGKKKPPTLDDNEPEPVMRSKSNSFSLVSPRPHHSIQFGQRRASERLPDTESLKFGKKTLPPDFAEKLLNLEIDIDINDDVPIETFQELVQTYMIGVEYYESIKDRKHLYFQRKLNALMTKPAFLMSSNKAIEKMEEKEKPHEMLNQVEQKKKEFNNQQKKLQLELIYGQNESKEAQVNELVESHSQNMKRMDNIIQKDILTQEDTIKKRLEKRKSTSGLNRASSLPRLSVEESVIQEAQKILEQQIRDSNMNPEEEKLSPTKNCGSPIDAISEEEEEGETSRKVSMRAKNRSICREVIVTKPLMKKRQSCYLGLDLIGELLRSQQSNKKNRSKSQTPPEQGILSKEEKEALKISLQETYQNQQQIMNKLKNGLRLQ